MAIVRYSDYPKLRPQVEHIFFQSAQKSYFSSDIERINFRFKWLDAYLDEAPQNTLLFLSSESKVIGYLVGWLNSQHKVELFANIPYYSHLKEHYVPYPAHFHINVLETERDKGIGAELVTAFIKLCHDIHICGIHVITNATNRNRRFYSRCGFSLVHDFLWEDHALVMLGKKLTT